MRILLTVTRPRRDKIDGEVKDVKMLPPWINYEGKEIEGEKEVRDTVDLQSELSPLNLRNSWIPSALRLSTSASVVAPARKDGCFYSLQDDVSCQ